MLKEPQKVLLYSKGCAGKTVSAMSALMNLPADHRVFVLMTERNAASGMEVGLKIHGIVPKPGQLFYLYPKRKDKPFANFTRSTKSFLEQSKKELLKGNSDSNMNKDKYTFFVNMCSSLEDFKGIDYATGEVVNSGHVGDFTVKDLLILDGLSVIAAELWNMVMGDKGMSSIEDYNPVQYKSLGFMQNLQALDCNILLLAHEKVIYKEVMVGNGKKELIEDKVIPNTGNIGTANYEQIVGCFTDVIHQNTDGRKFFWDIRDTKYDTRLRNINIPSTERTLEPNFPKYNYFR